MYQDRDKTAIRAWFTQCEQAATQLREGPSLHFTRFIAKEFAGILPIILKDNYRNRLLGAISNDTIRIINCEDWENWPLTQFQDILLNQPSTALGADPSKDFRTNMRRMLEQLRLGEVENENPFINWAADVIAQIHRTNPSPTQLPLLTGGRIIRVDRARTSTATPCQLPC
jgi:hypothetical protein